MYQAKKASQETSLAPEVEEWQRIDEYPMHKLKGSKENSNHE